MKDIISRPGMHIIVTVVLGIICYANTLDAPFVFDDIPKIVENPYIRDVTAFHDAEVLREKRYLAFLTFALNYRVHGFSVMGYHIVNILIHLINALLVYVLVIRTFEAPFLRNDQLRNTAGTIAFLSALLFVSHPVQTQAVTYIVQRMTSLAALFYGVTIVLYGSSRLSKSRGRGIALYVLSVASALCAMKTKEIAFTLPIIITVYEFLFFEGSPRRRIVYLLPMLLTLLVIPAQILDVNTSISGIVDQVSSRTMVQADISRWIYLFTQFRVIVTYVRLLFLPVHQNLDYDYPIYATFFEGAVLFSFVFLLLIIGCGAYLLYRSSRSTVNDNGVPVRRYRLIAFGIFWFFITLSVESSIIPIADVIFEHRLYLPSTGIFIAVATSFVLLADKLRNRIPPSEKWFPLVMLLLIVLLSSATVARNAVWKDAIGLWEDVVRKSPGKAEPHDILGTLYAESGQFQKSIGEYQTALRLRPDFTEAYYNLGTAYYFMGRPDAAVAEYKKALKTDPLHVSARYNLGTIYLKQGMLDEALHAFELVLRSRPDHDRAHYNLGVVYLRKGYPDRALKAYKTAISINPSQYQKRGELRSLFESVQQKQGHD